MLLRTMQQESSTATCLSGGSRCSDCIQIHHEGHGWAFSCERHRHSSCYLSGSWGREFELQFESKCVWACLGCFYNKFSEKIRLKAPGSYSASLCANNFSFL